MKRAIVITAILAASPSSHAQDSPATENFWKGEVTLGVVQTDSDALSSKFLEYRDIPNGLSAPTSASTARRTASGTTSSA